ncbi:MAG TPA: PadR family transcriptional regulator [Chryseosolibacter sp.]
MINSLDYIILGLLNRTHMSGYRLRMLIGNTALRIYSNSPGSIYPALRRLTVKRLVVKRSEKGKDNYSITARGVKVLKDWFGQTVTKDHVEKELDLLQLKFTLMEGLVSRKTIRHFLESYHTHVTDCLRSLREQRVRLRVSLPLHARLSLGLGISTYQLHARWCKKILSNLNMT